LADRPTGGPRHPGRRRVSSLGGAGAANEMLLGLVAVVAMAAACGTL